jgi:hypothetical protein
VLEDDCIKYLSEGNLKDILNKLFFANSIEKEDKYFKINIDALAR